MKFEYSPKGVCSRHFEFEIENNIVKDATIVGGCQGNLRGIVSLIKGMEVDEIINRLAGTTCGPKPTSCPDQIANALKAYKAQA